MKWIVTARLEVEAESPLEGLAKAGWAVEHSSVTEGTSERRGKLLGVTGSVSIEEAEPCPNPQK